MSNQSDESHFFIMFLVLGGALVVALTGPTVAELLTYATVLAAYLWMKNKIGN